MSEEFNKKLEELRADYAKARGEPFRNFYCPILFADEPVPLCKAHVVNQRFPNSARNWTIQREDVDNFFGSNFESDFVDILYHESGSIEEILADKDQAKRLKPQIAVGNQQIEYYHLRDTELPPSHTQLDLLANGKIVELGAKIPPAEMQALQSGDWSFSFSKDLRLAALVSLMKASHLTLFELLGYNYGLSAGSAFLGPSVLGRFFRKYRKSKKRQVLEAAVPFFSEFVNMVRPVQSQLLDLKGTISDGHMLVCGMAQRMPWALIVFVRMSTILNAVLMPIFESVDAVPKYYSFLTNDRETLRANRCIFSKKGWEIDTQEIEMSWPKGEFTQL